MGGYYKVTGITKIKHEKTLSPPAEPMFPGTGSQEDRYPLKAKTLFESTGSPHLTTGDKQTPSPASVEGKNADL